MANVVKYKKTGDINLQGGILLDALTASNVPNAESGKKTLFLDVADTTLKTKDSSGTVAAIGGSGGSGLTAEEVTTDTNIANGKLYIANSSSLLVFTLPATFAQGFQFGIITKGTGGAVVKSGDTSQVCYGDYGNSTASDSSADALTGTIPQYKTSIFTCATADTVLIGYTQNDYGTIATITASGDWTVPTGVTLLKDVWIIGGGGGGGGGEDRGGGGGGAGGVARFSNILVNPSDSLSAVIGAGGAGGAASPGDHAGTNGGNSTLTVGTIVYTANGGGGGGAYGHNGGNGGSGGGGVPAASPGTGISASLGTYMVLPFQGHSGGASPAVYQGAGGGGYGSVGATGASGNNGNDGGNGIDLRMIVGTSVGAGGYFAGGGGGGGYFSGATFGGTGKAGGGNGGYNTAVGGNATANTGSGGGGHGGYSAGGNGGSGIIIIRY